MLRIRDTGKYVHRTYLCPSRHMLFRYYYCQCTHLDKRGRLLLATLNQNRTEQPFSSEFNNTQYHSMDYWVMSKEYIRKCMVRYPYHQTGSPHYQTLGCVPIIVPRHRGFKGGALIFLMLRRSIKRANFAIRIQTSHTSLIYFSITTSASLAE